MDAESCEKWLRECHEIFGPSYPYLACTDELARLRQLAQRQTEIIESCCSAPMVDGECSIARVLRHQVVSLQSQPTYRMRQEQAERIDDLEAEAARLRQRVAEAEKLIDKVLEDEHEAGWSLGLDWVWDAKAWRSLSP
jgi:hypothetical protein